MQLSVETFRNEYQTHVTIAKEIQFIKGISYYNVCKI